MKQLTITIPDKLEAMLPVIDERIRQEPGQPYINDSGETVTPKLYPNGLVDLFAVHFQGVLRSYALQEMPRIAELKAKIGELGAKQKAIDAMFDVEVSVDTQKTP